MAEKKYNDRFDNITYEKGWQRAGDTMMYTPAPKQDKEEPEIIKNNKEKKKHGRPARLLLIVQLALCILLTIAVLVFKYVGGENYNKFKTEYLSYYNNSMITTPSENLLDMSELFETTVGTDSADEN